MNTTREFRARIGVLTAIAAALAACGGSDDDNGGGGQAPVAEIRTVSTRADMVSGGDALVEIVLPAGATTAGLRVDVGGRDVSSAFAQRADGRVTGLVTGLAPGENALNVRLASGAASRLVLNNTPKGATIYSGAPIAPFYCAGPTPQLGNGTTTPSTGASGLSGQPDANCDIPTEFKLYYKSSTPGCTTGLPDPVWNVSATATTIPAQPAPAATSCFKPYDPAAARPADLATATNDAGVQVPYIVRVERGTMNRGIYDIAVLFDPTRPAWTAVAPQPQWNGKVYINFGASTGQPRRQVRPATNWTTADAQLARGYMVVANSMMDSARNSNRVLMSETTMLMKEHIGDSYGPIKFTIGNGCSGGSINSNMNASINPGLLDGITTTCTYPDSETTSLEVGDCTLLVEAYQKTGWLGLMTAQGLTQDQINAKKAAINGHPDQTACHGWYNAFGSNGRAGVYNARFVTDTVTGAITQSPTATNNCELPNTAVYDPANPAATANLPRCNAWSWGESIWGKVPGSPAARDTRDNVGVQYGLKALQSGAITGEEFVVLNETVGGIDRDSTPRAARSAADREALDIAYRSGIVASGRQLAKTAIIDMRGWDDSSVPANVPPGITPPGNPIHHVWYSFAIRDRLTQDAGDARNQALWRFANINPATALIPSTAMANEAFASMDQWLTTLKADTSAAPIEQKVRNARPASTADHCYLTSNPSVRVTDQAACDADRFLQPSLSPRQVAGGPRREDVLKCQLKPVDPAEYGGRLDAGQLARIRAVFPDGVCDWTKPGVGQQVAVSPLSFKAGPGGQPIGAAPVSARVE